MSVCIILKLVHKAFEDQVINYFFFFLETANEIM